MKLFIICGSPRSGTTWFHNRLIQLGVFKGIEAKNDEYKKDSRKTLCTDEFYPLMYASIHYVAEKRKKKSVQIIKNIICKLQKEFGINDKLMIESPYYVFSIGAFVEIFGEENIKVIFLRRNILDVATSMSKHVHIGRLLQKKFENSFDFYRKKFLKRSSIEARYAHHAVYRYVRNNYTDLTTVERAFFKWHYFNRAYYLNSESLIESNSLILDYDNLGKDYVINSQIETFIGMPPDLITSITANFHPRQHQKISLTDKGKILLDKIEEKTKLCS